LKVSNVETSIIYLISTAIILRILIHQIFTKER